MSPELWSIVGAIVAAALIIAMGYNRLVTFRQAVNTSWSNIDTELQRRHDLVPNLVEITRAGAVHERRTQEAVARARGAAMLSRAAERVSAESMLIDEVRQLLLLTEAYPELKAQQGFTDLQRALVRSEDRIQAARRLHNNNVQSYNRRIQTFPLLVLAKLTGFRAASYLDFDRAIDEVPEIRGALGRHER
ncbi:MAG: LemA family protein [Acidimicrobiia bacterium]